MSPVDQAVATGKDVVVVETVERTYFTAVIKGMGRMTLFHDSAEDIRAALRNHDPDGFAHVTGWNGADGVQEVLVRPEAVVYIGDERKGDPGPRQEVEVEGVGLAAALAHMAKGGPDDEPEPGASVH